jgi:hydrogenase/urease accessory protein HupE
MRAVSSLLLVFVLLLLPTVGHTHPMQVEAVVAKLRPQEKFLYIEFVGNIQDITQIPEVTLGDERRNPDGTFPADFQKKLEGYINQGFRVTQGGQPWPGELTQVRYDNSLDVTRSRFTLSMRYPRTAGQTEAITITNTLFDYLPNAETMVVTSGTTQRLKTGSQATINPADLATNLMRNVQQFLVSGMEHIFTGPDHMLFIFAFLLATPSFRAIIKTLTGFTIAHSVTLILTTLGILSFPARLVDVVVALSIVFVGVENIIGLRRDSAFQKRFWVATCFGFIHGFAFAGNLKDMGLPEGSALVWSLLSFNLGVETAQILICCAVFPLLLLWRRDTEKRLSSSLSWKSIQLMLSGLIAGAGLVWMFQRLFGG